LDRDQSSEELGDRHGMEKLVVEVKGGCTPGLVESTPSYRSGCVHNRIAYVLRYYSREGRSVSPHAFNCDHPGGRLPPLAGLYAEVASLTIPCAGDRTHLYREQRSNSYVCVCHGLVIGLVQTTGERVQRERKLNQKPTDVCLPRKPPAEMS